MAEGHLPVTLVMTGSNGSVYVWNGCGGYTNIGKYTDADIFKRFDDFAAWIRAGNGRGNEDVSPAAIATMIEACRLGFPQPYTVGTRPFWKESELDDWMEANRATLD